MASDALKPGEPVLLIDSRDRELLLMIAEGDKSHTHAGMVDHDRLVGAVPGSVIETEAGKRLLVVRPTAADIAVHMARGAQIVYPKDQAALLGLLSLEPGLTVLESGVGSAALTMALLRAGVDVVGVERREDFLNLARKNIRQFLPPEVASRAQLVLADANEFTSRRRFDRIVLDLVDPWAVLGNLSKLIAPGGLIAVYVTNVNQVVSTVEELRRLGWVRDRVIEVLERTWVVRGDVVRPEQRMVGHTAFLISACAGTKLFSVDRES